MDYDVEGDVARTRHSPCSLRRRLLTKRSRLGGSPASDHLQAGNVNTGGCDPYPEAIQAAKEHQALVHVDGAFGLWAGASR
jgi:hypothetical protein